jgi:phosphoserine phosphatase RsbU/P
MSTVVDSFRLQQAGSLSIEELVRQLETQREQELNEARAIRLGMMPRGTPETADITVCYDFQPFHEVGGDFLDFFQLSDQTIGIYIGDVTGKGLPATPYAALAVGTLRRVDKTGTDPAAVLSRLNRRMLLHNISHRYASTHGSDEDFERTNGGTAARDGGRLSRNGTARAVARNVSACELRQCDAAVGTGQFNRVFSDGLSDMKNHAGDFFGNERICDVCSSMLRAAPQEQSNAIRSAVKADARGRNAAGRPDHSCPELQTKLANGKPGLEIKLTARGVR